MPTYCYTNEATGKTIERHYPLGKAPRKIRAEVAKGILRVFYRDMAAEHAGGADRVAAGGWPQVSDAMSVAPDEAPAMRELCKKHGVRAEFRPDGTCVLPSQAARKDACRLFGMYDRDAGYGDAAPR